jgi:hypothetical protein
MKLIQKLCEVTGLDPNAGAWAKVITGLDKSQHNGYSLLGDTFVPREQEYIRAPMATNLYLVGTKHYELKTYALAEITTAGYVAAICDDEQRPARITNAVHDWAVQLWPYVDNWFHIEPDLPSDVPTVRQATLDAVVKLLGGKA